MLYPTKNVCYFICEPLWASPYLVGLVWYALSYFRMCLYQAFFWPCEKTPQNSRKKVNSSWKLQGEIMLNMLYHTKNVCYFMCEPLWASPYLLGLVWYALNCFRMCLYQAFFCHAKKLKTQGKNWNSRSKLKIPAFCIIFIILQ